MRELKSTKWRNYASELVFLLEFLHLAWEHTHGGIVSHHFLARADMPAISNAWGLILLPALTWFLAGRIQRRVALHSSSTAAKPEFPKSIVIGFVATLLFGAALSVAFVGGYKDITSYLFFGMLLSAVVLPVYRAECVLGFVLGMTLTFGAILPTIIGAIIATVSAALHLGVYPVIVRGWIWFRRT